MKKTRDNKSTFMIPKYNPHIKPGILEVYCGPMRSGKTRELLNRVDKPKIMDYGFLLLKPDIDTRDNTIKSRFGKLSYECIFVDHTKPETMFHYLNDKIKLVAVDEAQFFQEGIEEVIEKMLLNDINVVIAGLELDFRGEPFGRMHHILAKADIITKLDAICEFDGCKMPATRTQRLIDEKPAHFESPVVLIGDKLEGYEPRCLKHHIVPGKPHFLNEENIIT